MLHPCLSFHSAPGAERLQRGGEEGPEELSADCSDSPIVGLWAEAVSGEGDTDDSALSSGD